MVSVRVMYFNPDLRVVSRTDEEYFRLTKGGSVRNVLRTISRKYGRDMDYILFNADGSLRGGLDIIVDGVNVRNLEGLDTRLDDTSTVELAFLRALGGG